jgi:1,4-alpha-glucan branching enzyme
MINKKISPKGRSVRVTFELPSEAASETVAVAGDFNEWSTDNDTMTLDEKRGVWKTAISFKPGVRHEFRYLLDGRIWRNDDDADGFAPNPYSGDNSVLAL